MTQSMVIVDRCDVPDGRGSGRGLPGDRSIGLPGLSLLGDARR